MLPIFSWKILCGKDVVVDDDRKFALKTIMDYDDTLAGYHSGAALTRFFGIVWLTICSRMIHVAWPSAASHQCSGPKALKNKNRPDASTVAKLW